MRTKTDTRLVAAAPRKMIPRLPDSSLSPAVINLLRETHIPRYHAVQGYSKPNQQPASLHIVLPTDLSRDHIAQALAKTEAMSPTMSYETMISPLLLQTDTKYVVPSGFRPNHNPAAYTSGYVTFPPFHKSSNSKAQTAKKYAKKVKNCLITVGNKFLTGLEAIRNFYAYSEQKWESEHQPFERVTSNSQVWEAIDAVDKAALLEKAQKAEKHQQNSWGKALRNYWKPKPAEQFSTNNILAHGDREDAKNEEPSIPPIAKRLRKQNEQRPERMQPSHKPHRPLRRRQTQERTEHRRPTRQAHFSPPRGRMHPLERQHSRTGHNQQQPSIAPEQQAPESEEDDEDLGTPWSALETVVEEPFFGGEAWEDEQRMLDDEGIGEGGGDGEGDCGGLEAGGELCLRHESCVREAMAIGGA
jgi:hypothetical protein